MDVKFVGKHQGVPRLEVFKVPPEAGSALDTLGRCLALRA
jgi:hypothetical protein